MHGQDVLDPFSDFQFFQSLFRAYGLSFQGHQIQKTSPSCVRYTAFPALGQDLGIFLSFHFLFLLCNISLEHQNPLNKFFFKFLLIIIGLIFCSGFGDLPVSQNPRKFQGSIFLVHILIHQYDQFLIYCKILYEHPFLLTRANSRISVVPVCLILLLCV